MQNSKRTITIVKTAKTPRGKNKCFKQQFKIHSKYNYKSKNQSNIMTILSNKKYD